MQRLQKTLILNECRDSSDNASAHAHAIILHIGTSHSTLHTCLFIWELKITNMTLTDWLRRRQAFVRPSEQDLSRKSNLSDFWRSFAQQFC